MYMSCVYIYAYILKVFGWKNLGHLVAAQEPRTDIPYSLLSKGSMILLMTTNLNWFVGFLNHQQYHTNLTNALFFRGKSFKFVIHLHGFDFPKMLEKTVHFNDPSSFLEDFFDHFCPRVWMSETSHRFL